MVNTSSLPYQVQKKKKFKNRDLKMLRSFVGRIQKGLSLFVPRRHAHCSYLDGDQDVVVPDDVKDGHFAVVAMEGEEAKRFVLELDYLGDPAFLGLLDRAREEYGFRQKGALALPCRPQELEKILDDRRRPESNDLPVIMDKYSTVLSAA